jgi:formate C-acetyltransferase
LTERIKKLREESLAALPSISAERGLLLTDFYKSSELEHLSKPVERALALRHILMNKKLCLNDGELIVGERGPQPKAASTYPELCSHSSADLELLDTREKIPYKVDAHTKKQLLEEVLPYWKGKSIRERIFEETDNWWRESYAAGIFTEFMEQRAPGHTVADDKIYKLGMTDFIEQINSLIVKLDESDDPESKDKINQLKGMSIAAGAVISFAERYSSLLYQKASKEGNRIRKDELETMAGICSRVPSYAPRTFWEALQYYWFIHLGVITELNTWDSFNPGRLDQHLYPFYMQDIESGLLTKEFAKELLQSFWIKFNNQPAPPKVGVTAKESSTYTDFCLINLGGVTPEGLDGVNELTYLILDVIEEMRLLQPSSMVQLSQKNPDKYIHRALKIIKTGYGQPSIFNTEAIIAEMLRQEKSLVDARCGGASGCVETGAFGKEAYILTGYFNLPKVLEITLNDGIDPLTGKQIGIKTGNPGDFHSYDELFNAFKKQLEHFINVKIKGNLIIEKLYAENLPAPFLSVIVDDCIKKGKDYNAGGARYNSSYIQGVGIGTITDSLAAIKYNVFDNKKMTMAELLDEMKNNFSGNGIQKKLLNETPKYGNDDDYADCITRDIFEAYFNLIDGKPNYKGGHFRINLLPTTCHVYFGSMTGATADGRLAHEPLSEGISPVQGADMNGPTAVIKSASKIDHLRTGGTLLNQKFTPHLLERDEDIQKVVKLIRTYFKLNGHHIQFNVVDAETLREAQKNPQKYRDLIVRVAGYSDYFVDLSTELQNEIIHRTEHK